MNKYLLSSACSCLIMSFSILANATAPEANHESSKPESHESPATATEDNSEADEHEDVAKETLFLFTIQESQHADEVLVKIVFPEELEEGDHIADAKLLWMSPSASGITVTLHQINEDILGGKIQGPFEEGSHEILASVTVRDENNRIKMLHEYAYNLEMPEMTLALFETQRFPDALGQHGNGENGGTAMWAKALAAFLGLGAIGTLGYAGYTLSRNGLLDRLKMKGKSKRSSAILPKDAEEPITPVKAPAEPPPPVEKKEPEVKKKIADEEALTLVENTEQTDPNKQLLEDEDAYEALVGSNEATIQSSTTMVDEAEIRDSDGDEPEPPEDPVEQSLPSAEAPSALENQSF